MKAQALQIIALAFFTIGLFFILIPKNVTVCTQESMMCPDGSYVGRTGPNCEFAPCPGNPKMTYCNPESRNAQYCIELYKPVCGWFSPEIQCIKYPCAQTFGNGCVACHNSEILYYTEGECHK